MVVGGSWVSPGLKRDGRAHAPGTAPVWSLVLASGAGQEERTAGGAPGRFPPQLDGASVPRGAGDFNFTPPAGTSPHSPPALV